MSGSQTELDPNELSGALSTPGWLRDLGRTSWLLVGLILLVVAAVWIVSLTHGVALGIHSLAVPVTSAVVRISADLARARGSPVAGEDGSAPKADAVLA